jgi:hypothetical protein
LSTIQLMLDGKVCVFSSWCHHEGRKISRQPRNVCSDEDIQEQTMTDLTFHDNGTTITLTANTPEGHAWLNMINELGDKNNPDDGVYSGMDVALRGADGIADMAIREKLTVEIDEALRSRSKEALKEWRKVVNLNQQQRIKTIHNGLKLDAQAKPFLESLRAQGFTDEELERMAWRILFELIPNREDFVLAAQYAADNCYEQEEETG